MVAPMSERLSDWSVMWSAFWAEAVAFVWGLPLVVLLISTGLYLTMISGLLPLRHLRHALDIVRGRYDDDVVLYRAISQEAPEAMAAKVAGYRAEGYRRFQLKVGCHDVELDINRIHAVANELHTGDILIADANTGWLKHEALRVCRGVRDVDVYIEQPCATYDECRAVRARWDGPFILDENIDGLDPLIRGHVVSKRVAGLLAGQAGLPLCAGQLSHEHVRICPRSGAQKR